MIEQIYQSLIDDAIEQNKNPPKRKHIFRTSMLTSCERKIMYGLLGYNDVGVFEGRSLLTLNIGTAVHEVIQSTLFANGWITNMESEMVMEEYSLNGHNDGDCFIDDDNQILRISDLNATLKDGTHVGRQIREPNAIFELKTINAQGFMRLFWNKSAKKDHIHQVNTYMGMKGYKKAVIVYLNKNGLTAYNDKESLLKWPKDQDTYIQSFIVDFDEQMYLDTIDKLIHLNKVYAENKDIVKRSDHKLPEKLPSGSSECNYCQFKSICKPPRKKKEAGEIVTIKARKIKEL